MKKNLFDFGDEVLSDEKKEEKILENEKLKDVDPKTEEEAKNLYNKYKDFSQDELIDEFLKTSKSKLKEGTLTQEKLTNTISNLKPYLNQNQKEFLDSLMRKLNE